MEKKAICTIGIIAFTAVLSIAALTGGGAKRTESRQIQDAMRELRRSDNIHFRYESRIGQENREGMEVWADFLTGRWLAEYSSTDEDGTLIYSRKLCDGKNVYINDNMTADWQQSGDTSEEVPDFDTYTVFPYRSSDMTEVKAEETKDGFCRISFGLSEEFTERAKQESIEKLSGEYLKMERLGAGDELLEELKLSRQVMEQLKQENVTVTYVIDPEGVLHQVEKAATISKPRMELNQMRETVLGDEVTSEMYSMMVVVSRNRKAVEEKVNGFIENIP